MSFVALSQPINQLMLHSLSIITITYNNPEEIISTYKSLKEFRNAGGTHIIINGGETIKELIDNDCILLEEPDKGIYDALNKGINQVNTTFFMLIHSGDILVERTANLEALLNKMSKEEVDFLLNDCSIEFGDKKRMMKSSKWKPWMFMLGAQPPHPPILYRTRAVSSFQYDVNHPIIADFKYLEDLFQSDLKWTKGNMLLIHMSAGGVTSSGLKSFLYVNKQFLKLKGPFKTTLFAIARPFIKVYQML